MIKHRFNTGVVRAHRLGVQAFTDAQVENEPMLFQSDAVFASVHGGGLTRFVLDKLEDLNVPVDACRFDTRSHLLGPGELPARGGWHCDFMAEREYVNITAEPDRDANVRHWMLVSGAPMPEFLAERGIEIETVTAEFAWAEVSARVPDTSKYTCLPLTLYEFDALELHRAAARAAGGLGWRWFFRASYFPQGCKFENKVRRQVQVYR